MPVKPAKTARKRPQEKPTSNNPPDPNKAKKK
jgi:hypothetical protein